MAELGKVTRAVLAIAHQARTEQALAERICRACVAGLDVNGASLSLLTDSDARETLWASDVTAELLEELQFTLNEGPCRQAAAGGAPVLVPDLHEGIETARWPMFAAAVEERSTVRAVFALPLQWEAVNLGVLDLYRNRPGGLPPEQWRDALAAAGTAALMMLELHTDPGDGGAGWMDPSLGHRAEIHQATEMVLAQLGLSARDALARLRGCAFVEQRLLVEVARDVVARRLRFTEDGAAADGAS